MPAGPRSKTWSQIEVVLKRSLELPGEDGDPVLPSVGVTGEDFISGEVYFLNTQSQAFHEAKARARLGSLRPTVSPSL